MHRLEKEAKLGYGVALVGLAASVLLYVLFSRPWGGALACIALGIGICFLVSAHMRDAPAGGRKPMLTTIVIWACVGCLIGGLAGAVFHFLQKPADPAPSAREAEAAISLACDSANMPVSYPASGDVWSLDAVLYLGLSKQSAYAPNLASSLWPSRDLYGMGYRCVVKNFGPSPAFGVSFAYKVIELEFVSDEGGGYHGGAVTSEHGGTIAIPRPLGPHGQDEFTFYVSNLTQKRIFQVQFPESSFIGKDGKGSPITGSLTITSMSGNPFYVSPLRELRDKPAKSSPAPPAAKSPHGAPLSPSVSKSIGNEGRYEES